ncbi:hypothetical protein Vretimale_8560 [Volvox reticuliferus]|uniref:Jacalin-type lectin domain-containing protein n=1 Tax=Volvox reticuliferus TaxID=1737510 RepID=A0A8J4LMT7_9CHLO|nr:hypothetical protein Vretifemale_11860 [Volvox reticuliferus]GIM03883.1 hypothetical protein Vretimale_8560 [Volvox reticuliferus]
MSVSFSVLLLSMIAVPIYQGSLSSVRADDDPTFFFPRVPSVTLEQIQDVLSRAQELREKSQQQGQARAVATAVAAAVSTLPPIQLSQSMRMLKMLPGEVHVHLPLAMDLLARIRALGIAAECRERHGGQGPPDSPRILIAANLKDCEEIMPFWILEVLRLALLLQGDPVLQAIYAPQMPATLQLDLAAKHVQRVGISVYESGSRDRTPLWLLVAAALWKAAGVPNAVVLNGTLIRKDNVLEPATGKLLKQHRIQHLASLRNAALTPLYRNPGSFPYVMFLNDVFFCAPELVRLTYLQADIACGVDVEVWIGGDVPKVRDSRQHNKGRAIRRRILASAPRSQPASAVELLMASVAKGLTDGDQHGSLDAWLSADAEGAGGRVLSTASVMATAAQAATEKATTVAATMDNATDDVAASWKAALERMSKVHTDEAAQQAEVKTRISQAAIKPRYEFYDIWVSRDLEGHAFIKHDPIARDHRTLDAVHKGLPFPVKCCWNGAVFINTSHLSNGLRFRAGQRQDGECDASECSIFCEDYRRLGSGRVAIDPSVRVSYTPWTEDVDAALPGGLPAKVPWSTVKRSGALERMHNLWVETANDMFVDCVPLRKGFDGADLDRVRRINIQHQNFTALFLERQRQLLPPPPTACNLIMGPYGADFEGEFFDDLPYASWGKNVITRIVHKASEYIDSIQVVYGSTPARVHGGTDGGEVNDHMVEAGEFINAAIVYYDDTAVHGIALATSVGRRIIIGNLRDGLRRAVATPCPTDKRHRGRYRLIAFAGTADRYLRSVTLLWS